MKATFPVLFALLLCLDLQAPAVWAAEARQSADLQQYPALASAAGRYVFGQVSAKDEDKFLLDTQTGRLWRMVQKPNTSEVFLLVIPYANTEWKTQGRYSEIPLPVKTAGESP